MEEDGFEDGEPSGNVLERVSDQEIARIIFFLLDKTEHALKGVAHEGFAYWISTEPRFQISRHEEKEAIRTKVDETLLILAAQGHIRSTMKPNSVGTPVRFWQRTNGQ